jgi:aspartate aminotransferase-like enzyme
VAVKLAENPRLRAVFATHNETSTTVVNDIAAIGAFIAKTPAVFVVDTVSALGGIEFKMDEWQVDVTVTGSQKALMLPPGLALVALSEKAWAAADQCTSPRFYFDLRTYRKEAQKGGTPYTPAVTLYFGLAESLQLIFAEGLDRVFQRHNLMKEMVRAGCRALGLSLMAEDACASATVTGVWAPEGIAADDLRSIMKKRYSVVVAGGQKDLSGKIFRIGHMGYAAPTDMLAIMSALEMGLAEAGYPVELGSGVAAAQRVLLESQGIKASAAR